jgi:hypothetical protein
LHAWAILLLAAACAVYIVFLTNLGIWLSLTSRNNRWANVAMAVVLLLLFGASRLSLTYGIPFGSRLPWPYNLLMGFFDNAVDPARTLWLFGFTWTEFANHIPYGDPNYWLNLLRSLAELVLLSMSA